LLLSPFVLAELDYLLTTRVSARAAAALLQEVAVGAYQLEPMANVDIAAAAGVIASYSDLDLGLTDASLVVLSERHNTLDLLTLDERHFRVVSGSRGRPFRILPADDEPSRVAEDPQIVPPEWQTTMSNSPMPDAVAAVRRSRSRH
jgi:predicted nucleic acid-binding protein